MTQGAGKQTAELQKMDR